MHPRSIHDVRLPSAHVIEQVRLTCSDLPENSTVLAESFYRHLFEIAPEARSMFAADMSPQHERMSQALLDVVRYLDRPEEVQQYLRRLGAHHHRELGIKPEHYPNVGRAMVRAVRDLSPSWSSSFSSSWIMVYEWITANMLAGAEADAEAAAARAANTAEPRTAQTVRTAAHGAARR
ncbi:hemoglobin-like flavoprotein [Spinactinospora alkalitolerans]|uniref:Hemoglobin-like flavoprotein n=1 Tax=Spinactinospora alkalitolerans TaxID=687207 RepID=A0A852U2A8_9ACTN|nr:globin domain-containing protein [Spinactinospora alkalitolerans]NYE50358.1 hemoglobin-like flavoprotein [Spinactinospora alkalitolerans]